MRFGVSSVLVSLALSLAGCAAGSAPPSGREEPGEPAPAFEQKASEIVARIDGLVEVNKEWTRHLQQMSAMGERQPDELELMVKKMQGALATLPADAVWVSDYVEQHESVVTSGFERALAGQDVRAALAADKIQAFSAVVKRAGGIDQIILSAAAAARDHAKQESDTIGAGHKMDMGFFCALAGTVEGANAAREHWTGVVGPVYAMVAVHCLR